METAEAKSAFVNMFGDYPMVKVLDFFLTFDSFDYSKTEVASETDISKVTIEAVWEKLIKSQIIVKSREIGGAELYRLNKSNPKVKALIEIDLKLSSDLADKEIGKGKEDARHHHDRVLVEA